MQQLKNHTDIADFVRGATFLGTGGGGLPEMGRKILSHQLQEGKTLGWVSPQEIEKEDYTACAFGMGSIAPRTQEGIAQMKRLGLDPEQPVLDRIGYLKNAVEALQESSGKTIKALVPGELGGGNSASGVALAAALGLLAVDGDYAGRALPEIQQASPCLLGYPLTPMASCDSWGDSCMIRHTVSLRMTERIGKMISVAGFAGCGMAGFLLNGAQMQKAVYQGTMSECLRLGRCLREALEAGEDPALAVAKAADGWILCRGKVTKKEWEDREGYYWGYHTITGEGAYQGKEARIWFKNENHICWINSQVACMSPDCINVIDDCTGEPYINPQIGEGQQVAVIAMRARPMHRSPAGLLELAPRAYGFDMDYVPVETLMRH